MKILLNLITIIFISSYVNAYEVQDLTKKELNKLFPKPTLESGGGGNVGSDISDYSFSAKSCKGSNKSKITKVSERGRSYDVFVACRITNPLGYHKHLRTYADGKARKYCEDKFRSKAYYRGISDISDLKGKAWRLTGDLLTLGLYANKRTIGVSYVCDNEEDPLMVKNYEIEKFSQRYTSIEGIKFMCEDFLSEDGLSWVKFETHIQSEADRLITVKDLTLKQCRSITGRETKEELAAIAAIKEKEKQLKEKEAARKKAEEEEKKRLAILETRRLEKIEVERINALDNKELCEESISSEGNLMPAQGIYKFKIDEINKRDISENECRKITGIYPKEILARMQKKQECEDMGFKDTEKIADCILRLIEAESLITSKELEAEQNKKLLNEQAKLDKSLEDQMKQFEIEQKKLDILLKQLEQAESQTAAAKEQAAAAKAQAAAAAAAASEAKKANRREGLKEAERTMKKGLCIATRYDYWNC